VLLTTTPLPTRRRVLHRLRRRLFGRKIDLSVLDLTVHVTHAAHRLIPVPSQRWHRTTLSPFLSVPLPSQFLHFCFFLPSLFCIGSSGSNGRAWRKGRAKREA
jgi:hypothetical protein